MQQATIRNRLRYLRDSRGVSQESLSEVLGFNDRQTLSDIELGNRNVRPEELVRAAQFFNVTADYFTDPFELAAQYTELSGKMAQVGKRLTDAMTIATSAITREDLICVTGSFYLVAEAIRKLSRASS